MKSKTWESKPNPDQTVIKINSIRNKFEMLTSLKTNEIDVLLVSDTGFVKPLGIDWNSRGEKCIIDGYGTRCFGINFR